MILIDHRRNTIELLNNTSRAYGVEIDIRSNGESLIIHHDPFATGERLEAWLNYYKHELLILNTKEEGLEAQLIELMKHFDIHDYFFLDQSFPFLIKWSKIGERRCSVRVSEFESVQTALSLSGMIDWVWIDCFTRFPINSIDITNLKSAGFKLCLGSPELHGWSAETAIPELGVYLKAEGIELDAICSKSPQLWKTVLDIP